MKLCIIALLFLLSPKVVTADMNDIFQLLNLDYPGLEQVKSAVESDDFPQARERLVEYYEKRTQPGWYWERDRAQALWSHHDYASADDILARKFTFYSKPVQLEKKIDWAVSPVGDREWMLALNRHQYLQTLGLAYVHTGDEKYAADFNDIIADWVVSNPGPDEQSNRTSSWRMIEAGIRTLSAWPSAWHLFKDSPSFTTDTRILMLRSFAEHADYLTKFPTGGNWNLMENNGLIHVGALFPEFKDAEKWRRTAVERLTNQMRVQVYPDGAQFELTTSYHNVSLWNLLQPVLLRRVADHFDFPKEYYEGLVRMQQFNAAVTRPDGYAPMINDSDSGQQFKKIFDHATELGGQKISALQPFFDVKPEKHSVYLPYSGLFCMRTGDKPDDLYLLMDAGPFGAGHQHEDKLNLEVYAYGRPFIVDPGRYSYTGAGGPFKASSGHNLILVDGLGQHRRITDRSEWVVKEPAPGNRWVSENDFDYAEGVYDDGFGDMPIVHVRKVFFIRPEYWIVVDVLRGTGEHKFEQLWHFMPGKVKSSARSVQTANADGANLTVIQAGKCLTKTVEGTERTVLGYYSPLYNVREPAPTAIFETTANVPATFETVLYPSPAGKSVVPEAEPISCLVDGKRPKPGQVSAISIRLPGYEDVFVICHDEEAVGKEKRFLNHRFTGEAMWVRTDHRGQVIKKLFL